MSPDIPPVIPDGAAAWLYDPTGQTLLGQLTTALGIAWYDQLNQPGSGSFQIPITDPLAASIIERSIVKFSYVGAIRFGVQIRSEECQLAVDGVGNRLLSFQQQPGLMAMLNDGTVLPEKGLTRAADSVRRFGFMSSTTLGAWYSAGDWTNPMGYTLAADTSSRKGKPPDLRAYGTSVYWVALGDPSVSVSDGTVEYFFTTFTTTDPEVLGFIAAFDDYGTVWIDGQQIISPDYTSGQAWRSATVVSDYFLPAGDHMLCVKIENAPLVPGHTNPVAFALAVVQYDGNGNVTGLLTQSDLTWSVYNTTGEPGWHLGSILRQCIDEMVTVGDVAGANALTPTFTLTQDSAGNDWADATTSEQSFPIGQIGLADVATQLAAAGPLDVWVDAATMEVRAYNRTDGTNRLGSDITSTVEFKLGDPVMVNGESLTSYDVQTTWTRYTNAIIQKGDGTFESIEDSAGISSVGRIYGALNLGSTGSRAAAEQQALTALQQSAQPVVAVTAQAAAFGDGPKLYVDYNLGDTATFPSARGDSTMKARILSVSVDASQEPVQTWPSDLVLDQSV